MFHFPPPMQIRQEKSTTEELNKIFDVFDRDRDGFIGTADLAHVLANFNEQLTKKQVQQMIDATDRNKDGQVDRDEFEAMMTSGGGKSDSDSTEI